MYLANKWKIITILLIFCCTGLAYRVFELGMTRTYLEASAETSKKDLFLLKILLKSEWQGLSEKEVSEKLEAYASLQPPESIVLNHDLVNNVIEFEGIRFEFDNGQLAEVL